MSGPRVSVLLLTYNGMPRLREVLDAVAAQRTNWPYEIVAVDSGSTDGSLQLLEERASRIDRISSCDFNHGLTRNAGVALCRGEFVVLLVQDAVPVGADWLAGLTQPLLDDPSLAGTFAQQRPREDASAITRHYLHQWFAAGTKPRVASVPSRDAFAGRSPFERFDLCIFDNVCSCLRRDVWERVPFRQTPIAEDLEWARDVLLAGYSIAFVPGAAVVHSHDRSASYELKRTYLVHAKLHELFGLRTIPGLRHLLRAWGSTIPTHVRCLAAAPSVSARELVRTLALGVAFPLGQYLGGLAAAKGWRLLDPKGI